ncbi:MAG: chorismate-binding protein, partial [Planctomycetota bacterium]
AHVDPDELRDAEKDAAELNMIIDLLRNDLGRVCDYGSVRVTQPRTVESHPTVHHGVATVTGRLHVERSLRHLLRATFPGGSITGAPKVRAMQIIDELEPVARGPYCGAIGYAQLEPTAATTARLSIAIRTLLIDREAGRLNFSVGGGIVADSDPAAEYDETLDKAEAMLRALRK